MYEIQACIVRGLNILAEVILFIATAFGQTWYNVSGNLTASFNTCPMYAHINSNFNSFKERSKYSYKRNRYLDEESWLITAVLGEYQNNI